MVAHCAVRAEGFRVDLAAGEVLPAKPNTWNKAERPSSRWKAAYLDHLCSMLSLKLEQRGLLLSLLKLSDAYGRVWWGQTSIAERAGCCARTLRRLLPNLEELGLLRSERMSFKSLAAEQRALGLPLPERSDEGRAPNLLTLLVDGRPANELQLASHGEAKRATLRVVRDEPGPDEPRPGIVRAAPHDKNVQGEPRTKPVEIPPDKLADDLLISALLIRKVEGDLTRATPPTSDGDEKVRTIVAPPSNSVGPTKPLNGAADAGAWQALNAAYDANYWRAYELSPTNKTVSRDEQQALTTMLVEGANLLGKRLRERNVDVETLEPKLLEMLANEALRAWFDKSGTNKHLRDVSHRMRSLLADLPRRVLEAIEVLIERYVPKPEQRKVVALVSATMSRAEREVSQDKPASMVLRQPVYREWPRTAFAAEARKLVQALCAPTACDAGASVWRPAAVMRSSEGPQGSGEIKRILEGLSARPALREFGTHVPLATELAMLAREHNTASEQVDKVLDEVNSRIERRGLSSGAVTTTALYAAAVEVFGAANAGASGGGA